MDGGNIFFPAKISVWSLLIWH